MCRGGVASVCLGGGGASVCVGGRICVGREVASVCVRVHTYMCVVGL